MIRAQVEAHSKCLYRLSETIEELIQYAEVLVSFISYLHRSKMKQIGTDLNFMSHIQTSISCSCTDGVVLALS